MWDFSDWDFSPRSRFVFTAVWLQNRAREPNRLRARLQCVCELLYGSGRRRSYWETISMKSKALSPAVRQGPSLTDECTRGGEKRREHGKKPAAKHATHRHRRTISQWMLLWKLMSSKAAAKSPVFSAFSRFTGWNVDRAGFFCLCLNTHENVSKTRESEMDGAQGFFCLF